MGFIKIVSQTIVGLGFVDHWFEGFRSSIQQFFISIATKSFIYAGLFFATTFCEDKGTAKFLYFCVWGIIGWSLVTSLIEAISSADHHMREYTGQGLSSLLPTGIMALVALFVFAYSVRYISNTHAKDMIFNEKHEKPPKKLLVESPSEKRKGTKPFPGYTIEGSIIEKKATTKANNFIEYKQKSEKQELMMWNSNKSEIIPAETKKALLPWRIK